tara:strand:+ start:198 stop:422 length:225 start_codon:yes stop_codon:yes gene_type:complete
MKAILSCFGLSIMDGSIDFIIDFSYSILEWYAVARMRTVERVVKRDAVAIIAVVSTKYSTSSILHLESMLIAIG